MPATRLSLICHAATLAQRIGEFPKPDSPLATVTELPPLPPADHYCCGPEIRCLATAEQYSLPHARHLDTDPELRDLDMGRWLGGRLQQLQRDEPTALMAWLSDPGAAPHGGESILELSQRMQHWLTRLPVAQHTLAFTHPMVIRVIVGHILAIPATHLASLDIAPLAHIELTHHRQWRLRLDSSSALTTAI